MGTSRTTPTWKVQVVSDDVCCSGCCGGGDPAPRTPRDSSPGAFAYTIGLHERGAPELHLWARPSEGEDPGADWSFSAQDMVATLNEIAEDLLAGRLVAGSTRTETYDGGDATVTFRLGDPVDRLDVDAFGADPAATVLPLRWSLRRPPEGTLGPADPMLVAEVRGLLLGLYPRPGDAAYLPPTWRTDALDFCPEGDFGPMTPLVRGLAAAVVGGRRDQLVRFLVECLSGYTTGTSAGHVVALARSAARRSGRSEPLDRLVEQVWSLAASRTDDPTWSVVVDDVVRETGDDWPAATTVLQGLLADGLLAMLATAVVFDAAPVDLLLAGTGPFRWSRCAAATSPPEFAAPPRALRAVADALTRLRPADLPRLLARHERACGAEDYLSAAAHLQGLAVTTPTALGRLDDVLPPPVAARAVRDGCVAAAWSWASLLVAAVCATSADPRRLSVELAEAFCAPYDDLVPDLRGLLGLGPHCRP